MYAIIVCCENIMSNSFDTLRLHINYNVAIKQQKFLMNGIRIAYSTESNVTERMMHVIVRRSPGGATYLTNRKTASSERILSVQPQGFGDP